MGEEEHMIRIKTSCHNRCFSLGVHIDFKHKYIDFHIWNWFIHLGEDGRVSEIHDKLAKDEMYELQDRMSEMTDKHIRAYNKNHHPFAI